MKVAVFFIVCVVACVYANVCSDTMPCDGSVTTCANGYTLTCIATSGTEKQCVCVSNTGNKHTCQTQADCHANNLHHCNHGHWACVNNHCHCTGGNGK